MDEAVCLLSDKIDVAHCSSCVPERWWSRISKDAHVGFEAYCELLSPELPKTNIVTGYVKKIMTDRVTPAIVPEEIHQTIMELHAMNTNEARESRLPIEGSRPCLRSTGFRLSLLRNWMYSREKKAAPGTSSRPLLLLCQQPTEGTFVLACIIVSEDTVCRVGRHHGSEGSRDHDGSAGADGERDVAGGQESLMREDLIQSRPQMGWGGIGAVDAEPGFWGCFVQ
ncbi:hypothetical protein BJ742DRAFT_741106 [Cladochytrium replicatum]|nr:hypothetical protein BJ742DRAFT_741106 [Cladochytrium replicatum]